MLTWSVDFEYNTKFRDRFWPKEKFNKFNNLINKISTASHSFAAGAPKTILTSHRKVWSKRPFILNFYKIILLKHALVSSYARIYLFYMMC